MPELDIKAKCAFGACRVMLVWESKSVRVMVWSCTLAKYWPPLADIFVYKGLISIVATGAREAAVSGFNLGIADCDVMVQDVALTIRAVANKMVMCSRLVNIIGVCVYNESAYYILCGL